MVFWVVVGGFGVMALFIVLIVWASCGLSAQVERDREQMWRREMQDGKRR